VVWRSPLPRGLTHFPSTPPFWGFRADFDHLFGALEQAFRSTYSLLPLQLPFPSPGMNDGFALPAGSLPATLYMTFPALYPYIGQQVPSPLQASFDLPLPSVSGPPSPFPPPAGDSCFTRRGPSGFYSREVRSGSPPPSSSPGNSFFSHGWIVPLTQVHVELHDFPSLSNDRQRILTTFPLGVQGFTPLRT